MKRLVLMIIPALICGVVFDGCGSKEPQGENTLGELYAMGTKSSAVLSKDKMDLLFTADDIISFDIRELPPTMGMYPGHIVFTDTKTNDLKERFELYTTVFFYLHGELVFDPPIPTYFPWLTSEPPRGLQLRYERGMSGEHAFFLGDFSFLPDEEMREKQKSQLDVFINYLRDADKIVE